jgi:murein L,D-transpeptidase YcbB/YkuD
MFCQMCAIMRSLLIGCLWLALLAGAVPAEASDQPAGFEAAARASLSGHVRDVALWDLARWRDSLVSLYAQRAYAPIWFREGRLTPAAAALLRELASIEERGLLAADYDAAGLQRQTSTSASAHLDVVLSVTAARLASDLSQGRIKPSAVGYDLDVPRPDFNAGRAVATIAMSDDVAAALDAMEPQLHHYALLKTSLAQYRALAATAADLVILPPLTRSRIRPGERYEGVPALQRLLVVLGDLPDIERADPSAEYAPILDPALVEAVKRFQSRHGLEADGILGRATFRALTTSFATRIRQIELSLERIRWLPPLTSPPIIVNIPQFRLFAFRTTQDFAQDILQMDVIVGEDFEGRRTPVFAADMRYAVLQPYWDVPRSILLKELLPEIRANPRWIEKNGFEIVRGESDGAPVMTTTADNIRLLAAGKLRLRQKPGPSNALGKVKFIFPNHHNVYLHDTPARQLFSRTRRAFSHGCIRVSDPMALLAHVMRDDPVWTAEVRDKALQSAAPVRVPLARPIRVYILYGTALATEAGNTLFFDDIYGQDAPLLARLGTRRANVSRPDLKVSASQSPVAKSAYPQTDTIRSDAEIAKPPAARR